MEVVPVILKLIQGEVTVLHLNELTSIIGRWHKPTLL